MARSIPVIYTQIISWKQNLASLAGLTPTYVIAPGSIQPYQDLINNVNSGSFVGRWRLWAWIISAAIWFHETLWDAFKALLIALASQEVFGTLPWYAPMCKSFQYGYALTFNPANYTYGYTDTTSPAAVAAQIINQAAVEEVRNSGVDGVLIKVATLSGGSLAPLSGPQVIAFTEYVNLRKPAGVQTSIISEAADVVKTNTTIYYDGTLDLPTFQAAILVAINNLLTSQIQFNGLLYLNGINNRGIVTPGWCDSLLAVPGCLGVEVNSLQAAPNATLVYEDVLFTYEPDSGYFTFNVGGSTITYIPQ